MKYNRRKFLQDVGRSAVLAGILGVSSYLVLKEPEGECTLDFVCQKCKKNHKCELEAAQKYREQEDEQKYNRT